MKPQWICSYLPYGPLWKCDPQDEVCILIITTTLYYTQAHTGYVSGSFSAHTMHLFFIQYTILDDSFAKSVYMD